MPFNCKIVASNTWNLIYLDPFYFVKCKISHLGKFLNNFFWICLLCLLLMFKDEYWLLQRTRMSFIPERYVCCLHQSYLLPWGGEFLKLCCWGDSEVKNWVKIQRGRHFYKYMWHPPPKKKPTWKPKLCEEMGELVFFPAFYLGEVSNFNTRIT